MNWTCPPDCRGLIFDCDGTVVDSMPAHYEAWQFTLSRYGITFPEEQFYAWAGLPIADIIGRLCAEQHVVVDIQTVAAERDRYFHNLPTDRLQPLEPVVAIARRYRGNIPMAIATGSTHASASASLKAIGVLHWFDAVISSQEVGRAKPAPDVFLAAARAIKVSPSACVAFEDGDAGLQSARSAGMIAIDIRPWIRHTP